MTRQTSAATDTALRPVVDCFLNTRGGGHERGRRDQSPHAKIGCPNVVLELRNLTYEQVRRRGSNFSSLLSACLIRKLYSKVG